MASDSVSVIHLSESESVRFAENSFYPPILNGEAGDFPIYPCLELVVDVQSLTR